MKHLEDAQKQLNLVIPPRPSCPASSRASRVIIPRTPASYTRVKPVQFGLAWAKISFAWEAKISLTKRRISLANWKNSLAKCFVSHALR